MANVENPYSEEEKAASTYSCKPKKEFVHPTQETRDIHYGDRRLREKKPGREFFLIDRPANGPAIWGRGRRRDGTPLEKMPEAEAHAICDMLDEAEREMAAK